MSRTLKQWSDLIVEKSIGVLIAGLIAWSIWITNEHIDTKNDHQRQLDTKLDRTQVVEVVATRAPYIQDKQWIEAEFVLLREYRSELLGVIKDYKTDMSSLVEKNTTAIQGIDKQLAALAAIMERIDRTN